MKQIYHFTLTAGKQLSLKAGVALLLMGVMLTLLPAALQAQEIKPFTQRTSNYSPNMPIYHIKGDYTMIGNTNLSNTTNLNDPNNYNGNNSTEMYYVDVDGIAFPTLNSSTAALTFSEEFGANPACSEVLYAGLYWTGITDNTGMVRTIPARTKTVDYTLDSGNVIGGYTLEIEQNGNDRIFTFTKPGSESVVLKMTMVYRDWVLGARTQYYYYVYKGEERLYYNEGPRNNSSYHLASLPNPVQLPGTNYTITQLYWNSTLSGCYAKVRGSIEAPAFTVSKNKIKIRHANAPGYTEVEAALQDIHYDYRYSSNNSNKYIYAAYTEVTDYVRQYGLGNYTVADLLTEEGNGGNLGYFGCWGMVVVYENSKMKWRDITIFDGLSQVSDGNTIDIPISGFKTVQVGDVNMKLGMMAAEGDRGITGDGCAIQELQSSNYEELVHSGNIINNFFNSSIETGGNYRYPNYVNNTGIDIAMLNIDNPDNTVIGNEQTSTTFRFKTNNDAYYPFCFVMGVDAYIPEAEALSGVMNIDEDVITIDSQTGNYLIEPGKEITFAVEVKNFGTEDIVNAKLEIPLPSTIVYYRTAVEYVHPGINIEGYFDAERYANGVAGWNIDYIPSGNPDQVYARVLLTVKVTEDCYVLASTDEDCELAIEVNGTLEGTSYVNGVYFKKESFISGFAEEGACRGNAIRNDIKVVVYKENYVNTHCQDQDYTERVVTVCENDFSDSNPIPFMKIYALYPQGSRFFNAATGVEYTAATGFPISLAGDTSSTGLIHVQPTSIYSAACTSDLRFILDPDGDSFTTTPTLIDSAYCLGALADSLSKHITSTIPNDVYFRFYKANNDSAVAYVDIVPPTDVEGTYTYYVRQFRKNAIGCEDENFYGPITIEVVSPITFRSSRVSPSCIGDTVIITGIPGGGRWSWPDTLTGIDTLGNVLTIAGTSAGTYTVTYTNDNAGTVGYSCTNTVRSYTHQIAATTNPGNLSASDTICQGAQIQPLQIEGHNGHVERWEWTRDLSSTQWDTIPNNTSSISSADLGELAVGTYYFRALVKDGNCDTAWTNTVTITVTNNTAPPPPDVDSVQYACIGIYYTIEPSDGNYRWYEQPIGGWPIKDADGNFANSVTVNITDAWITRYVSEVDNSTGCVSNRAEVQVRPNLEPGEINDVGQRECDTGQPADEIGSDQNAVAYGEEPTVPQYQWYVQVNGDTTLREIDGANFATFTPSAYMDEEGEYIFIRKAKNPNCDADDWQQSRGKWRLVVGEPDASIKAVPGHATICKNRGIKLHLSVPASTAYSYQWYKDGDSITNATGHEYIATAVGTYTARVTHKASGCSATTPEAGEIEVKYDDDAPRATSVDTTLNGCGIEVAQAVTAYDSVRKANASGLGFNIYDSITPVDSLKLTYTEAETETEDLPDGVCYQLVRTYTVTDQCGFYTTFTHTINVVDTEVPELAEGATWPSNLPEQNSCFANRDITELLSNDAVKALYTDNCGGEVTVESSDEVTGNDCGWTVTRTYTITDSCNNSVTKTMSVSGRDSIAPSLTGIWPENITGQNSCLSNADTTGLKDDSEIKALYSDCSAITVTHTDAVEGNACGWTVTRTYTITDSCGNTLEQAPTMIVSGSDQTAPSLIGTWPTNITGQNNCFANADTTGLKDDSEIKALYSDCSAITVTHEDANTSTADCGWTVTRTYTITDLCGNTVMPKPTMSVSGSDQTDPVIESINLNRTLTSTNCVFRIPDMRDEVRNISTDCSEIAVTQPSAGMEVYPMVAERDTTVNVVVTDICGNSSVKEVIITIPAKVTISATATPAVICNGGTSQLSATAANVVGTAVYAWTPATELSSATIANPTVTLTASGASETVTYTVMVTDDNGCTATATASVTVNPKVVMDTVADWTLCVGETSPEYVYTSTITDGTVTYGWRNNTPAIGLAAMGEGNLPSFVAANATPANLIAEVKVAPTYTNNDISCQGDSINFHITVRPSIKTPGNVAFTCPADTTVVLSYSECEQFVNIGYPEFVNNMSGMTVNITNDAPEGNIFPEGTTIVTWTATDECGAFLTCTQNVVVQFPSCGDSIADFDGYRYSSVRIGCQCWTGENARSEHYSDGTPVDNFRYYNDSDSLESVYGKLYSWYAAVRVPEGDDTAVPADSIDQLGNSYVQGICPEGWALPTVDEYMLMIANSGDATHAKDGSNLYWLPGYEGQPPFSGFDAYGAGKYNEALARYEGLLGKTYFWTTLNVPGSETATTVEINYYCAEGLQTELSKGDGVSIRCIRKR